MEKTEKGPIHVAIIPDGNRRWAKERNLPSIEGHRVGAEQTLPALLKEAKKLQIQYLTFWVLSPENLNKRSPFEIKNLLNLRYFLIKRLEELKAEGIRIEFIGDLLKLPSKVQKDIMSLANDTKDNNDLVLTLAINYGGKDELLRAMKKLVESHIPIEDITKEKFSILLDTARIPDPDLIIRTGGEHRLSGFMLWQNEYTEFYFSKLYFPDFTPEEFEKAVEEYKDRQRRFGK